MADQESPDRGDGEPADTNSLRQRLFRLQWRYLRGWLVIAVVVFVTKLASKIYSEISESLGPVAGTADSRVLTIALVSVILIILPWAIGGLVEFPLRYLRSQRGFRALRQVEKRLSQEFRPDEARGYRVALINFPSESVQTLGLITSTFWQPETDREMAAVYLPGTPDPSKGSIHVVGLDDLVLTGWTLGDITNFHITFGSGVPT